MFGKITGVFVFVQRFLCLLPGVILLLYQSTRAIIQNACVL